MSATTGNPESFNLKLIGIVLVLGMVSAACAAATTDSAEESSVVVAQGESSGSGATGSSADGEAATGAQAENIASGNAENVDPSATIPPAVSELVRPPVGGGGNPEGTVVELMSFTSPSVGGPDIDASTYLGRDVVLWFWAPWCSWCNTEAPRVSQAAVEFDGEVEIIGMAGVSDMGNMQDFVDRHQLEHITHVADLDGSLWLDFDVTYQPWWIFINDDGTVTDNWQGRLDEDELRQRLEDLQSR